MACSVSYRGRGRGDISPLTNISPPPLCYTVPSAYKSTYSVVMTYYVIIQL